MRRLAIGSLLGLVAFATLAAGCAHEETAQEPATAADRALAMAWGDIVDKLLASAPVQSEPATQSILLRAQQKGELDFALYDEAVQNLAACLRTAGLTPTFGAPTSRNGLDQYSIVYEMPLGVTAESPEADRLGAAADACQSGLYDPIAEAYVTQPDAYSARDAEFEKFRPAMLACLRELGSTIAADATAEEVTNEAITYLPGHNCFHETGYGDALS